jgi:hypothetical protein
MPQRPILYFDIEDRQHELRDSVAPDDFVLRRRDTKVDFPQSALAYCADLMAERVLYTAHGADLPAVFGAPFLYSAQLESARHVVSVPFERLGELDHLADGHTVCQPTLIFSPGRTGSTLLARLLSACGAPCASEPDMLSQVCRFVREDRLRMGFGMEVPLLRACLGAIFAAIGPSAFIKLRSHCNARPLALVEAAPGCSVVFLLRRLNDWALSRHRAFAEPPESVALVLRHTIDALDKLTGAGVPLKVLWFEDLRRDPASALVACLPLAKLRRGVDVAAIRRVMASDSQEGTGLAREAVAQAPVDDGFLAAFERVWPEARASAMWCPATEDLVAGMWDLPRIAA